MDITTVIAAITAVVGVLTLALGVEAQRRKARREERLLSALLTAEYVGLDPAPAGWWSYRYRVGNAGQATARHIALVFLGEDGRPVGIVDADHGFLMPGASDVYRPTGPPLSEHPGELALKLSWYDGRPKRQEKISAAPVPRR